MTHDKYGTGQDPYCIPRTDILKNKLNIIDANELAEAELALTELAAIDIEFARTAV